MPKSNLSVNVIDVKSGQRICSATVYLYHPPFALDVAVDYTSLAPGATASELFNPPKGWGVLRSSAGLLLWLQLNTSSPLQDVSPQLVDTLRFEFEAVGGGHVNVDAVNAGSTGAHTPLALDEGMLHAAGGRMLHVRLASHFDGAVKQWLSFVNRRSLSGAFLRTC